MLGEFIFALQNVTVIIILKQDDFLPRTATPLEDIFKSLFWYGSGQITLYGVESFYVVCFPFLLLSPDTICKVDIAANMETRALFLHKSNNRKFASVRKE